MGDMKLCYGCFEPINDEIKCPNCGYKQKSPYSQSYIAPGTLLNDRYTIGKLISHNGEGATYLAFDTVISCKILIKEYMPDALCTRVKGSPVINVNHNNVAQYKSLMAEFTELNKQLAKLRTLSHINPVLDLFSENNTTYAVFEYIDGVNFIQHLKENAGELSWNQVSKMFPPLFTSLSILHNAGIVHRGISPQTIYVTTKGELKLTDFCIAAVRTTKTELNAEIFKGYAAPEQYSPSSWQGAWTDVYGLCSVLYRILTGCMPTEALLRSEESELTSPYDLNSDIPENVSKAIMDGLRISGDERIQTVTELVTRIFEPSQDEKLKTSLHPVVKPREYDDEEIEEEYEPKSREYYKMPVKKPVAEIADEELSTFDKFKFPVFIAVLLILIAIFFIFIFKGIFAGMNNNDDLSVNIPALTTAAETTTVTTEALETEKYVANIPAITLPPESDVTDESGSKVTTENANANIQMADLKGLSYEQVKLSTLVQDISLEPEYVYSDEYDRDVILWQDTEAGVWVESGAVVKIKVSRGNGAVEIPNYKKGTYSCYPIDEYLEMLDKLGIKYRAIPEVNNGYYPGYVIGLEPAAGTVIDTLSGDVLIVHFTEESAGGTEILSPGVGSSAETAISAN